MDSLIQKMKLCKKLIALTVVLALCFTGTALAAGRTLKSGYTGEDVLLFQNRLIELGYLSGTASGVYDSATRNAVKSLQTANALKSDGVAGTATQDIAFSSNCVTMAQYNASRQLKSGNSGDEVTRLQTQLQTLGYYTFALTGKFDTNTRNAVKTFQEANGLRKSGIATVEMRLMLNAGKGITAAEYDKVRPLKSGNSGAAVTLLQQQLKKLGYYTAAMTGKYDTNTRNAVKTFQTANSMKASGTADVNTRTLINSGKCVTAAEYNKICTVKSGSKGAAVSELQRQLTAVQFYDGAIDGIYDSDIRNAVKSFQTANGLKTTGTADLETRKKMTSGKCVTGETYNKICALKSGNSGIAVKVLQRQLRELGYYAGNLDGKYSSAMRTAVKTFQTANGLKASGTADVNTRTLINSGKAMTAADYNKVCPLKSSSKGDAVVLLQKQMKALGYYAGAEDGKYGSALKTAVKTFQTANQLKATGTADVETRKLINSGRGITAAEYDKVRPLSSGNSGSAVTMVQQQLTKLGYYVYTVNGKFDSNTRKAVSVFQTANGIKATGKADVATRTKLNSGNGATREQYDARRTLKKGELGSTVRAMQNRLIQLGYMNEVADGNFQSSTRDAVKRFQKAHSLVANGIADVAMREKLFSAQALSYADYLKVCPIKSGERSDAVGSVQRQLAQLGYYTGSINNSYSSSMKKAVQLFQQANGFAVNSSKVTLEMRQMLNQGKAISLQSYQQTLPLARGDKGDAVKLLQKRLTELGYYIGSVTGNYDAATQEAVQFFQKANSIGETGTADTLTRKAMNSANAITKTEYDRMHQGEQDKESLAKIEQLIAVAKGKMGCKYVHNTSGPLTFDCSGFTRYCFRQVGIELSAASYNQGYMDKLGKPYKKKLMTYSELQRGDLLVFDTDKTDSDLSDHLGIYLGDGTFIHASSARGQVVISNLIPYGNFSWAFRLL